MTPHDGLNGFVDTWLTPGLWLMLVWSLRWSVLIAVAIVWFTFRRPRAALLRMLVLRLVLLCGLALPFLPTFWGPAATAGHPLTRPANALTATRPKPITAAKSGPRGPTSPPAFGPTARSDALGGERGGAPLSAAPRPRGEPLGWMRVLTIVFSAIWCTGALAGSARLAVGALWLKRSMRGAEHPGEDCMTEFERCRRQLGVRRRVELAMHPAVESPLLVGGRRPRILVPTNWPLISPTSRRAALLHELAHAKRRDDYAKLGEELVRVAFFFHPLVYWLLARIDADREELCDAAAVKQGVPPRELAQALLEFCRNRSGGRWAMAPCGAALPFFRRGAMKARIQLLLKEDHTMSWWTLRPSRLCVCAVIVAALGLFAIVGGWGVRAAEPEAEPAEQATSGEEKPPVPTFKLDLPLSAEDVSNLQAGKSVQLKGFGTITLEDIVSLAEVQAYQAMTCRLTDVQGNPLVAQPGKPIAARVTGLCRGAGCPLRGTSSLADADGRFFCVNPPDGYEAGRMIPILVQTASGQVFEACYVPSQSAAVDVCLPTHLRPKVEPSNDVGDDEIGGVVVDEQGNPLEGVEVDVYEGFAGLSARTDGEGRFRIRGCDKDEAPLLVRFRKPGYSPLRFMNQPLGINGWVVALDSRTYFEGTVRGPDGKPVANTSIRANQGPKENEAGIFGELWTETTTDDAGRYRLYVQPDEYEFFVKAPGIGVARLLKQPILHGKGHPLDIELHPGATFKAIVVDSLTKRPVAGVRLWHWQHPGVEGRSGADGRIAIGEMIPGPFKFNVEAQGFARWWSDEATEPWDRKSLANPKLKWQRNFDELGFEMGPDTQMATVVVERAVRLRGRVLDPEGRPVGGATVAPALTGSGNSLTGDTRFSVESDADGRFEMLLPASHDARYNLVAHDGKYQQWRTWANGVSEPFSTQPGEEIEGVELKLTRGATIRGTVFDAAGRPVSDVSVRADATDQRDNRYYAPPAATTDPEGRFELHFLRPADYHVSAVTPGVTTFHAAKPLAIGEAQVVDDVDIRMAPPATTKDAAEKSSP